MQPASQPAALRNPTSNTVLSAKPHIALLSAHKSCKAFVQMSRSGTSTNKHKKFAAELGGFISFRFCFFLYNYSTTSRNFPFQIPRIIMKREVKFSFSACFTDEFFLLRNAAKYLLNINEKVNHSLISPSRGGWQNSFMLCVAFIQFNVAKTMCSVKCVLKLGLQPSNILSHQSRRGCVSESSQKRETAPLWYRRQKTASVFSGFALADGLVTEARCVAQREL